jgi:hypothetical protein
VEHRQLFPGVLNAIALLAVLLSFALPFYAVWFWASLRRHEKAATPAWRRLTGIVAAVLATCSIVWRYLFPLVLHHHYSKFGSEDEVWWAISLWSIRAGVWISAAGLLLALFALGRARLFAAASSAIMAFTYCVLFALR